MWGLVAASHFGQLGDLSQGAFGVALFSLSHDGSGGGKKPIFTAEFVAYKYLIALCKNAQCQCNGKHKCQTIFFKICTGKTNKKSRGVNNLL